MSELRGCTDGNCIIRKPEGMHTNGGCGCERELRHALGLQDSRRFIHALRERQREVAELREALKEIKGAMVWLDAVHDELEDNSDVKDGPDGPEPNVFMRLDQSQALAINLIRGRLRKAGLYPPPAQGGTPNERSSEGTNRRDSNG